MKTRKPLAIAGAALFALPWPGRTQTVTQEAQISVQQRYIDTVNGPKAAKYEEYQEVPNGFLLDFYNLELDYERYLLELDLKRPNQSDQSFSLKGGKPGSFQYCAEWSQSPHIFSNEGRSLYRKDGGVLKLADGIQTAVQGGTNIRSFLDGAQSLDLRTLTEEGKLDLKFRPTPDLVITMGALRQHRTGSRPLGGSFGFSNAVEIPEPVDHTTHEANLNIEYSRPRYQWAFAYQHSQFHNGIPALIWDNHKRITDQSVSATGYVAGDQSAAGRMALAPDNRADTLNLSGGMDLPLRSRLSADLGYSKWEVRTPMLPYTINSAVSPGAVNAPPFDASNPSNLPSPFVDAKMEVFTQFYKLSTRPFDRLRASLSHRSYMLENRSPQYEFPGYVRLDQVWSATPQETHPYEYRSEKSALNLDYDIIDPVSLVFGASHEYLKRSREVDKGREYQLTGGATVRPSRDFFVNLSYLLGLRRMSGFDDQHYRNLSGTFIEMPGLRRFDVGDRNRNQGRVQAQYNRGEAVYSVSARLTRDDYRVGKGDLTGAAAANQSKLYGLLQDHLLALGTDASIPLSESASWDVYYEFDYDKRLIQSNTNAAAVTQDPASDWRARVREVSNVAGVALNWLPRPKLKAMTGYEIVYTRGTSDPVEDGTGGALSSLTPTTRMTQTLKARAEYSVNKDLTVIGGYEYEKFDISDFALDGVPLATADAVYLGASLRNYHAHLLSLAFNYKFGGGTK